MVTTLPQPGLYTDPATIFAGSPQSYVAGFFPKNATINPQTGAHDKKPQATRSNASRSTQREARGTQASSESAGSGASQETSSSSERTAERTAERGKRSRAPASSDWIEDM